ncbi:unnamed protein product [Caenorhabditis auriculariae]|uniref:GOST seven transmembrane domain-containing protein n=1 Tax=Caenorhabditis auriculariae TaxID=2777116 RepID=A0A8S1GTR1_9PELO|nr:unnamed protein product [Caenorhabditis auriculariae]
MRRRDDWGQNLRVHRRGYAPSADAECTNRRSPNVLAIAENTTSTYLSAGNLPNIVISKIHHLSLRDDSRRNIVISNFGYGPNGTIDIGITNFTVPDKIKDSVDSTENADKLGVIGFSLSRGSEISHGVGSNPHVCQLQQTDQGFDAIFLFADLPNKRLRVYRSGVGRFIRLCPNHNECALGEALRRPKAEELNSTEQTEKKNDKGWFGNFFRKLLPVGAVDVAYDNYIPLEIKNSNQFSTNISIRFDGKIMGDYYFIFHNCYNYRAHGYSDRVAVDFTVDMIERNVHSYLSINEIPKPQVLLYVSMLFFFTAFFWAHRLCIAEKRDVYRVHYLMAILVFLKAFSLLFHGVNYYFVSKYGHQREIWAVVYYITHLLKGALLFGTIILIGTGYTFMKNFLSDRDRKVFMVVLPFQVLDNIFLIILSESEIGQESHQMWLKLFVFLDILCCFAVLLPIVWSIQHLHAGASSDGKAAFNLAKLRLFRQFYILVIAYIYTTRLFSVMLKVLLPAKADWVVLAVVELVTFLFFVVVGMKFRPGVANPYLKLATEEDDDQDGIALTKKTACWKEYSTATNTATLQIPNIPKMMSSNFSTKR